MTKNRAHWIKGFSLFLILLGWVNAGYPQNLRSDTEPTQVKRVRIGPHPVYTRILINLDKEVAYNVKADFLDKGINDYIPTGSQNHFLFRNLVIWLMKE